jgi:hypothetical protein
MGYDPTDHTFVLLVTDGKDTPHILKMSPEDAKSFGRNITDVVNSINLVRELNLPSFTESLVGCRVL